MRLLLIPLIALLSACSGPVAEFDLQDDSGASAIRLFPDSSFIELVTIGDSSIVYAGQWYGSVGEASTFRTKATRVGFEMLENPIIEQFRVEGGRAIKLIPDHSKQKNVFFVPSAPFDIDLLKYSSNYPSSMRDTTLCKTWKMDTEILHAIIKKAKPVSSMEWHHLFGHFSCQMTGVILQKGKEYDFSVNAGAWMNVSNEDSNLILGNFDRAFDKYFIAPVWREGEEEER